MIMWHGLGLPSGCMQFLKARGGNFAFTTAIMLPVLVGTIGLAIDSAHLFQFRNSLQQAADSATLATSSKLGSTASATQSEAEILAKQFLAGQMQNQMQEESASSASKPQMVGDPSVAVEIDQSNPGSKRFAVTMSVAYDVPLSAFSRAIGLDKMRVSVNSISESSIQTRAPLSLYFVLDKSGSMSDYTTSGITKIQSLKIAANTLLDQLDTADPTQKYVRTGAVAYSHIMRTPTALAWGTWGARIYINNLNPGGNTDSGQPTVKAYTSLAAGSENAAHQARNGQIPTKIILLMTDGENNVASADQTTLSACTNAKNDGMLIYTVALMAPPAGQSLLSQCASGPTYYFEAENTQQLVDAFKAIGERAADQATRLTN